MAMVDLAENAYDASLPLAVIAERQRISTSYLEQLFLKLRRSNLVMATRGVKGGYRLARKPSDISIAEIMEAAEEQVRMNRCSAEGGDLCLGEKRCTTHGLWKALGDHISDFLDDVSLQDVLDGRFSGHLAKPAAGQQAGQCALAE